MSSRATSIAAGLALAIALSPLAAVAKEDSRTAELREKLDDPMTQYAVAGMLSAMSKSVLEMPIEPILKAMEGFSGRPMRDLPPDATLGDLAGTDSGEVRDKLIEHVPRAMKAAGGMADAVERMRPEIGQMAKKMKDAVPRY